MIYKHDPSEQVVLKASLFLTYGITHRPRRLLDRCKTCLRVQGHIWGLSYEFNQAPFRKNALLP